MKRNSGKRARFALAAVAGAVLISLVAMPASAFAAKAATRIVTTATKVVHSDTQGTTGWPVTITAKLQRKSGSRWVAASGTVRLYLWADTGDEYGSTYHKRGTLKGSTFSFPITERGKYKLVYSGTSTRKPSTAYSRVYESAGIVIGTPVIDVSAPDANMVRVVHVRCAVDWNTTARPGGLSGGFHVVFDSGIDSGGITVRCNVDRWLSKPGTVEYWYAVTGEEVAIALHPEAYVGVEVRVDAATIEPQYAQASYTITN